MIEKMEARIALCKCKEGGRIYGVRFEKAGDNWKYTWAFPVKEASAKRENYDKTKIVGNLVVGQDYPGCPFCMGFSLLRALEFFAFRKMEMPETKTHLLCGWRQSVIQKITFPLQ